MIVLVCHCERSEAISYFGQRCEVIMSYFEKNLKALEKKQPELAELMRKEIDTSHIEVLTSETGIPTARVTPPEGKKVLLHDLKDPVAKAKEHVKKFELIGNNGSVLLGFGLGYLALEMVNSMEEGHMLIICEADPALFKVAMVQVDLEPVLKSERVKLLLGKDVDITTDIINLSSKFLNSKISVVKYHPSLALDPETYTSLERKSEDTAIMVKVNANTLFTAGREMAGNILANAPDIIRSSGVKTLFDKLKDIPAIIVGAGPSLEKNVALLKEVRDRAVIIAVDRALGLLLPLGITPHLVPSIDFSEINYNEKYAPLQVEEKLFMVFSQTMHHKITKTFWGPKFVMHMAGSLSNILSYYWGDKGSVSAGLHVGHLAFTLANAMGCNPIIMVGMDLAYTEDKIHAQELETSAPGYTPSERFAVEGIFGEKIKSDAAFKTFVLNLNEALKTTNALCIDATEGGAKKEKTKIMRLRDALEEYCQIEHPEILSILEEAAVQRDPVKLNELIKDLQYAEDESKQMKKTSESIPKIVKKLKKMKQDRQELSQEYIDLTHKAEKLTDRAEQANRILAMLEYYNFTNILFMKKDDIKKIDAIENQFEKLDKQLERAETYYKNFLIALTPFIQDIQHLIKRLVTQKNATEAFEKSSKQWSDYLRYGLELIKSEHYTDAEVPLNKVIELNPDYSDAYYHLGRIYSEQNRFETAIPFLKKAVRLKSNFTKAKYLLKKCQEKNQKWEGRRKELREKYFKDSPKGDGKELFLGAGNFYFRVKDYKRAEEEYLKVVEHYPDLPEAYYHLGHTYFAMKDFEKGIDSLTRALEYAPHNHVIYRDLGLVSIDRGLVTAAEKFFLKALELKPDDPELKMILGNTYLNNCIYDKAIALYEELLQSYPTHQEVTRNLSRAYQALIKSNKQLNEAQ